MAQIGAGSYVVYSDGQNSIVLVYRGQSGGAWVVDFVAGTDPNGPRKSREYRDASGQATRLEVVDGPTLTFNPNNCTRTLGLCRFRQNGPEGQTLQIRQTELAPGGFSYSLALVMPDQTEFMLERGTMQIDALGVISDGRITGQDGPQKPMRLVQAVYR